MYTNPRRINRNAQLGQWEAMNVFVIWAKEAIAIGNAEHAYKWSKAAWHAAKLAGKEAVKAARRKNLMNVNGVRRWGIWSNERNWWVKDTHGTLTFDNKAVANVYLLDSGLRGTCDVLEFA